jgi:hypothetical protein
MAGCEGIQSTRASDDMELHSQAGHEDLVRLTHAWRKLGTDECNKTFEIVSGCTSVIGNRNLLQSVNWDGMGRCLNYHGHNR